MFSRKKRPEAENRRTYLASWATVKEFEAKRDHGDNRGSVHNLARQNAGGAHRDLARARDLTFEQVKSAYRLANPSGSLYAKLKRSGEERLTYYECRTDDEADRLWAVIAIKQVL